MLSIKQGSIKYHFLSLWYDSNWDWTRVSQTIQPMARCIYIYIYIYRYMEVNSIKESDNMEKNCTVFFSFLPHTHIYIYIYIWSILHWVDSLLFYKLPSARGHCHCFLCYFCWYSDWYICINYIYALIKVCAIVDNLFCHSSWWANWDTLYFISWHLKCIPYSLTLFAFIIWTI